MSSPPEIITAGPVVLRRETTDDAPTVAALIAHNLTRLSEFMPWAVSDAADEIAQHDRIVAAAIAWDGGTEYDYVVTVDGAVVGKCGLPRRIEPDAMELGYWLDESVEGRGYATAAARALTEAALDLDGVSRVEIHCDAANTRSLAVPRRLGYVLDRTESAEIVTRGQAGKQMIWVTPAAPVTTP